MSGYSEDVCYAYELISLATKRYSSGNPFGYVCVLNGFGISKVGKDAEKEHNYKAVVDAIHLYEYNNSDQPAESAYEWAIIKSISSISGENGLNRILNILYHELDKIKNSTNSFVLNFELILNELDEFEKQQGSKYKDAKQKIDNLRKVVNSVLSC